MQRCVISHSESENEKIDKKPHPPLNRKLFESTTPELSNLDPSHKPTSPYMPQKPEKEMSKTLKPNYDTQKVNFPDFKFIILKRFGPICSLFFKLITSFWNFDRLVLNYQKISTDDAIVQMDNLMRIICHTETIEQV